MKQTGEKTGENYRKYLTQWLKYHETDGKNGPITPELVHKYLRKHCKK